MKLYPTKKLGEVCEIITGGTPKTSVKDFYGNEFLWAGPSDLDQGVFVTKTNKRLSKKGFRESGIRIIPKNSIMMSCIGYIGKVGIANEEMATNQQINTFVPNPKLLDSKYLYYSLIYKTEEFKTNSSQTTLPIINKTKCSNISIPIPPLEIQRKIVERIEKLMAKIDEAKKLRKEAMTDASSLIPSALNKIFEEGKKKGWEEKTIGDLCIINPRADIKNLPKDMEISFVPMKAVDEKDGIITIRETRKLSEVSKGYTYFANNDVLFAKITPCMENGKSVIARDLKNGIGFGSTEFHVLRTKGEILPELIHYHLRQKSFREEARKRMTGSAGQKRVPKDFLEKSKIILPSLPEQQKIVKYLDSLSEKVRKIQNLQSETEMELKLLEKAVLNNAFVV